MATEHPEILEEWYRDNPDDATEHDPEDIYLRFQGLITMEQAVDFYKKIQRECYGDDGPPAPRNILSARSHYLNKK